MSFIEVFTHRLLLQWLSFPSLFCQVFVRSQNMLCQMVALGHLDYSEEKNVRNRLNSCIYKIR